MQTLYKHRRPGPAFLPDEDEGSKQKYKEFDFTLRGIKDLESIDWYDIQAASKSETGSRGVAFLQTKEGSVALKAPIDIPLEFFTYLIMKFLKVKCPEMRIIRFSDPEYDKVYASIDASTYHDQVMNSMLHSKLRCPFLMVFEYISGISFPKLGPTRANHFLSGRDPISRSRLINLGILLSVDTLLNNSDRIPILWDNRGNTENLLFQCISEEYTHDQLLDYDYVNLNFDYLYAIDNRPSLLDHRDSITAPNIIKYLGRLENFLKAVFKDLSDVMKAKIDIMADSKIQLESIAMIVKWIKTYSGYDIPSIGQLQLLLGIIIGYTNLTGLNKGILDKFYEEVCLFGQNDYKDYWKNSCKTIHIPFLVEVLESVKIACNNNPAEVSFAHHVTLNQYKLEELAFEEFMGNPIRKPEKPFSEVEEEELEFVIYDESEAEIERDPKRHNSWLRRKLKEVFSIDEEKLEANEEQKSQKEDSKEGNNNA